MKCDEKCTLKIFSVALCALKKTGNFIAAMMFLEIIQRLVLSSWNIKSLQPIVQLIGVFASLAPFTLYVGLVFVLVLFLFQ